MGVVPDHVTVMADNEGDYGEAIGPVDYGCVRRYRHRRLATFLWIHGFRDTLRGLVNETNAFMSVAHLSGLVRQGLWEAAILYLARFLPPTSQPLSDEAQVLIHFLRRHKSFASILAGVRNRDLELLNHNYNTMYLKHDASVSHDELRIRSIVLSLLNSPQVRASLDWDRVRHKASQIVYDLAFEAPELRDLALLPGGSMMPHAVLPIGFRSSRRSYYVKKQHRSRPENLTKIFLKTKKRLPSSTHCHELNTRLTEKTRKWLVDIVDESLQAGSLELQSSGKKGVSGATVLNTMSNTLTDLTRNSVSATSSLANAGDPVAAVSQTVNMTSHAENSGISAVINAGQLLSLENSNLRKHPRTEEIIFEQDPHKKMQRTSGAFGEACLTLVTKGVFGNPLLRPNPSIRLCLREN